MRAPRAHLDVVPPLVLEGAEHPFQARREPEAAAAQGAPDGEGAVERAQARPHEAPRHLVRAHRLQPVPRPEQVLERRGVARGDELDAVAGEGGQACGIDGDQAPRHHEPRLRSQRPPQACDLAQAVVGAVLADAAGVHEREVRLLRRVHELPVAELEELLEPRGGERVLDAAEGRDVDLAPVGGAVEGRGQARLGGRRRAGGDHAEGHPGASWTSRTDLDRPSAGRRARDLVERAPRGLVLEHDAVPDEQVVEPAPREAAQAVCRVGGDGLPGDVERRVQHHRHARAAVRRRGSGNGRAGCPAREQVCSRAVPSWCTVAGMRSRILRTHGEHVRHVRARDDPTAKYSPLRLGQDRGPERPERLAELHLGVDVVLHLRPPRVGEDRAVAQRPRPELHASLVPAHDLAAASSSAASSSGSATRAWAGPAAR